MFWPSTQPSRRIDCQNGLLATDFASSSGLGAEPRPRIPTRAIFSDFWAAVANDAATRPSMRTASAARTIVIPLSFTPSRGGGPNKLRGLDRWQKLGPVLGRRTAVGMMISQTVLAVVLALCLSAAPLAAHAQQAGKVPRIGFLGVTSPSDRPSHADAFRQRLRELGWVEGQILSSTL